MLHYYYVMHTKINIFIISNLFLSDKKEDTLRLNFLSDLGYYLVDILIQNIHIWGITISTWNKTVYYVTLSIAFLCFILYFTEKIFKLSVEYRYKFQ